MIAATLPAPLVRRPRFPAGHRPRAVPAVLAAVQVSSVAPTADVEDAKALATAHLPQAPHMVVGGPKDDLTLGHPPSVHGGPAMAKKTSRKKRKASPRRPIAPPAPAGDNVDAVVSDTAARFTCTHEVVADFLHQLDNEIEDLEMDIDFNQVALEIWQGRAGRAGTVTAALTDYLGERRRNLAALTALRTRFADLAAEDVHEHLDPVEPWRDFIRRRLFPDPPTS